MPGVQKTPEPTRHRAHVHARERRKMLLDLKTSRRHATNGLFGVDFVREFNIENVAEPIQCRLCTR